LPAQPARMTMAESATIIAKLFFIFDLLSS
jgi:hypothetical protein